MDSAKNRTFETSWSRLETALNIDDSCVYTESRPKTTASLRKYKPTSHRLLRNNDIRNTSISKSFHNRLSRPMTTVHRYKKQVPGLSVPQVQLIYAAKCQDLGIPVLYDQEKRFFNFCVQSFSQRRFRMKDSGISYNCAKVIGDILKTNDYFAYLDLSKNLLKDSGVTKLARRIAGSMSLVHLDVSSNEISPEGNEKLLDILTSHSSLVSIDLSSHEGLHRNRLATVGSQAVGRLLANSKVLSVMNLAGTGIGPDGLEYIIEGMKDNLILACLNLANNNIGGKSIEKFANCVVTTDLRELNLSSNKIGNEGCEYISLMLSGAFQGYCMLSKLDISNNEITTSGLSKLFAALRINNQLSNLCIKKNNFSKGLSQNLSQFLMENVTVLSIDFSHCEINCEGLLGLSEGLSKNNGLQSLNFSSNFISDKGAETFFQGLCKNKSLKHLDLSSNKIKDRGGLFLAQAVQENDTLESLHLKNNSLKDESAQKFSELSRWKKNILRLVLDLNPLNFKYLEIIKNNIKNNHEYQQKSLVPKLQEIVDRLQFRGSALEELHIRIMQKQKERNELEMKLRTKGTKLEDVKATEEAKFFDLKNEYNAVREISLKLSHEIEELNNQMNVIIKQKAKFQGEKVTDELCVKLSAIDNDLKGIEKQKISVKEAIINQKGHNIMIMEQFNKDLQTEEIAKRSTESTMAMLKRKLEEKRMQVELMKNPKAFKTEPSTDYLASEKLAFSKKKKSVSPPKPTLDLNLKRTKRRIKSVTRKSRK